MLRIILKKIRVVKSSVLKSYEKEADKIVKNIDPDDSLFFACALANSGSVIWSNDAKLKTQNKIRIIIDNSFDWYRFLELSITEILKEYYSNHQNLR